MKNKVLVLFSAVALTLAAVPAWAHHGDAGRYEDGLVIMKGTVVEAQLVTPHSILVFDVADDSGKTVRWQAEMNGRAQMIKDFGWTSSTLKPGDHVTITGRKVKSGAPYMNLTDRANIVLTDSAKEVFRTPNYGTEERKRPVGGYDAPAARRPSDTRAK